MPPLDPQSKQPLIDDTTFCNSSTNDDNQKYLIHDNRSMILGYNFTIFIKLNKPIDIANIYFIFVIECHYKALLTKYIFLCLYYVIFEGTCDLPLISIMLIILYFLWNQKMFLSSNMFVSWRKNEIDNNHLNDQFFMTSSMSFYCW